MSFWFKFLFLHCQESSKADDDKEIVEINMMSAVIFVVTASAFLLLLYYLMSAWFVWVLIVLFCIGGIQVWWFILVISQI